MRVSKNSETPLRVNSVLLTLKIVESPGADGSSVAEYLDHREERQTKSGASLSDEGGR